MAWYVTTSFRDDVLEKEIDEKYAEVTQAWLELIKEQEASRSVSEVDPLEFVDDWAADPRTPEQQAHDDWCADVEATRAMDYPI